MNANIKSKTGFYVGDICYVLSDKDYHEDWGEKYGYEEGCYEIRGSKFAVASTACGDGDYDDDRGHSYGVDAGVIGIVPLELCSKARTETELNKLGRYVEGKNATFESDKGVFQVVIGNTEINIDTRDVEDEEDEDY